MNSHQIDWKKLTEGFHRRESANLYMELVSSGLTKPGCAANDLITMLTDTDEKHNPWPRAFTSGENEADSGEKAALLAYSLFVWAMDTWELSSDFPSIALSIAQAKNIYDIGTRSFEGDPRLKIVNLFMNFAATVPECMAIETNLYNCYLTKFTDRSEKLFNLYGTYKSALKKIEEDYELLKDPKNQMRSCLDQIIQTQTSFYCALYQFGKVACEYRLGRVDADDLQKTIRLLQGARKELRYDTIEGDSTTKNADSVRYPPDVLMTELLPYERVLEEFIRRLELSPTVRFDDVRIIYVFPFTIPGLFGSNIKQTVSTAFEDLNTPCGESTSREETKMLGSLQPFVHEAELTDLWKWKSRGPHGVEEMDSTVREGASFPSGLAAESRKLSSPRYEAVDAGLPPLTIKPEDGDARADFRVTIRFTSLGSHYIRIETNLSGPNEWEVNQYLRRASPVMVEESVHCGNYSAPWPPSINKFVIDLVDGLHALDWHVDESIGRNQEERHDEINAHWHVISEVRSAFTNRRSIGRQHGEEAYNRHAATEQDIERFAGSLLLQPLNRLSVAPDDWVCFRTSEWKNLLEQDSFTFDFAVGKTKSTLLSMPGSPEWFYNSYEECIELAAALPPLLKLWSEELRGLHQSTKDQINSNRIDIAPSDGRLALSEGEINKEIDDLRAQRRQLHDKIVAIRLQRTYLTPDELVGTGHHRAFLQNLYDVARISNLLGELDEELKIAELVDDRAVDHVRYLTEQRRYLTEQRRQVTERQRALQDSKFSKTTQYLLLIIGSFAFAGVAEMFDHQLFGEHYNVFFEGHHNGDEPSLPWYGRGANLGGWILIWVAILAVAIWWVQERPMPHAIRLFVNALKTAGKRICPHVSGESRRRMRRSKRSQTD